MFCSAGCALHNFRGDGVDSEEDSAIIVVQCSGPMTAAFKVISESFHQELGRWT